MSVIDETPSSGNKNSLIGLVLDQQWTLTSRLGRGGIGHVYEAIHNDGKRRVAVKLLRKGQDWDDESETLVERFYHEAQILRRLQHPGIIDVYDFGFEEEVGFYLIMELLQGQSLLRYMQTHTGLMPWKLMYRVLSQVCDAMGYAHKREIVHRDLKPEHIFLLGEPNEKVRVKVFDFGIARFHVEEEDERLTQQGVTLGTPRYLSPEQTMGANIDHRSDIYTLCIILFELLTRRRVFQVDGAFQLMTHHAYINAPSIAEARPELNFPPALVKLVSAGLAKEPDNRPQSMEEFRKELFAALRDKISPESGEDPSEVHQDPTPQGPMKVTGSFYMVGNKRRPPKPTTPATSDAPPLPPNAKLIPISTPAPQPPPPGLDSFTLDSGMSLLPLPDEDIDLSVDMSIDMSVDLNINAHTNDENYTENNPSPASENNETDDKPAFQLLEGEPKPVKIPSVEEIEALLPPLFADIDELNDIREENISPSSPFLLEKLPKPKIDTLEEYDLEEYQSETETGEETGDTMLEAAPKLNPAMPPLSDPHHHNAPSKIIDNIEFVDDIDASDEIEFADDFDPNEDVHPIDIADKAPGLSFHEPTPPKASEPFDFVAPDESLALDEPVALGEAVALSAANAQNDALNEADTFFGPAPELPPATHTPSAFPGLSLPTAAMSGAQTPRSTASLVGSSPTDALVSTEAAFDFVDGSSPSHQQMQAVQRTTPPPGPSPLSNSLHADRQRPRQSETPQHTAPAQRPLGMKRPAEQNSSHSLSSIPQIYDAPRRQTPKPGPATASESLPQIPGLPNTPSSDRWRQAGPRSPRPMIQSAMRDDVLKQQSGTHKWLYIGLGVLLLAASSAAIYFFFFATSIK